MNNAKRIFLDWNTPALDRAVEHLTVSWTAGPLDLRDQLLLVPTRHAGRRLRERLAMAAAAKGTGVLIGRVEMPSFLFRPPSGDAPLAADLAAELFWRRVLAQARPGELAALGPETLGTEAAARAAAAAHIRGLRDLLCEEGYDFRTFLTAWSRADRPDVERGRWQCLVELEQRFASAVQEAGWRDDVSAKLMAAAQPALPDDVRRVVALFVPDPPPLALRALANLPPAVPVEICVHAPTDQAALFDPWGRPDAKAWPRQSLTFSPSDVEICDDAISMAERVRALVAELDPGARAGLVVGVGDPQTAGRVAMTLARDGIHTFDPSGTPAGQLALFALVDRLLGLCQEGRAEALFELLRHPYALRRLERDLRMENALLAVVDEFQNQQMPVSFAAALETAPLFVPQPPWLAERDRTRKQAALTGALAQVSKWMDALQAGVVAESLPSLLAALFEGMPADDRLAEEARLLADALQGFAELEPLCPDRVEKLEFLRKFLSPPTLASRRQDGDLDLLGWLELAWEDAPGLLLTDLNDGLIPESATGDPFLPDGVRAEMGLRDNGRRLARDAYLLETLVRSRPEGQVRGFVARRSGQGDLLRPSRLLFQGAAEDLPRRALYFFADGPPVFRSVERKPGWLLAGPDPGQLSGIARLSVSSLNAYLECPFNFYLKQVARLDDPFEPKHELDPGDFGSLQHRVFEAFARGRQADARETQAIEASLHEELDRVFARRFGSRPALPLLIQHDLLRQRLTYAARVQAAWREAGWKIDPDRLEHKVTMPIGDFVVSAIIDRIDVNEKTGEVCVMDYKTFGRSKTPEAVHTRTPRGGVPPELAFAATPLEGTHWSNLQLPLYVEACATLYPAAKGRCRAAYFVLPNAAAETGILTWDELEAGWVESAKRCAAEIFRRVRAGVFWPPRPGAAERDFGESLFFEEIERHLEPALVEELKRRAAQDDDGGAA